MEVNVPARIDLLLEFMDGHGDEALMRDHANAGVSYALPLPGRPSLAFTLTYTNHVKFLGEQTTCSQPISSCELEQVSATIKEESQCPVLI